MNTDDECAQEALNAGVNLFASYQTNLVYYCYIYTKTQSTTTCDTKETLNSNVYRVTRAASPTSGKSDNVSLRLI